MLFVLNCLSLISYGEGLDSLCRHLTSGDVNQRKVAIAQLVNHGPRAKGAIPNLICALRSEKDPPTKIKIMEAIAEIDFSNEAARQEILHCMNDPYFDVRLAGMNLFRSKMGLDAVPHFVSFVADKTVKINASMGILGIGFLYRDNPDIDISTGAIDCFISEFKNPECQRRQWAAHTFSHHLAGRKGTERVISIAADAMVSDNEVRTNFVHVLAAYGERSLPYFRKSLSHKNPNVRIAALVGLELVGKKSQCMLSEIELAKSDPDEEVRFFASFAFDRISRAKK